jgi:GNAT superfamily N-acetyltransferase
MKFSTSSKTSNYIKIELKKQGKQVARGFLFLIKNQQHKRPYGLMEDVFVSESLRGQGIGSRLIAEIVKEAKNRKCYKLIATSRASKPKVHKLYRRLGFKKHGLEFRMEL